MSATRSPAGKAAAAALKLPVHIYRHTLAFLFGGRCRHMPSCSQYALDAIELNGAWRGFWLTLSRMTRCHPWGTSGFDPAPDLRGERHPLWAAWRYGRWRSAGAGAEETGGSHAGD